jgi:hypothetical protein
VNLPVSRRNILNGLAAGALSPILLTRTQAEVTPDIVQFRPEIEPLVSLIERTPREKCAEMAVEQLRNGVSYRQFLGALFLAGIRNVNPRPPGFALHCVFVIHSAHQMSLDAPPDARLLPLFYALDNFKTAQDRDARNTAGDFWMRTMRGTFPAPERAAAEFSSAMEAWDIERAERAAVALVRYRGPADVFAMLWRYGARDYRNIGHKAIYVANASRTLNTIGWQHAEPVIRSLVLALLDFGKEQKVNGYALNDQCYAANQKLSEQTFAKLNSNAFSAPADAKSTREILTAMRDMPPTEACADVSSRLMKGTTSAASVMDAVHLAAAELRMRALQSAALASVHAVTSANAMHHAYSVAPDPRERYLLLLQAVGWMGQFRTFSASGKDGLRDFRITDMQAASEKAPLDEILAAKAATAAPQVFRISSDMAMRNAFLTAALRNTLTKAEEVHFYKYLVALMEDVPLVSAEWQPHLMATTVYYLKGSADPDSATMKRAREALRSLPA